MQSRRRFSPHLQSALNQAGRRSSVGMNKHYNHVLKSMNLLRCVKGVYEQAFIRLYLTVCKAATHDASFDAATRPYSCSRQRAALRRGIQSSVHRCLHEPEMGISRRLIELSSIAAGAASKN